MKKLIIIFQLLAVGTLFVGCEEEGDPFTLEDAFELNDLPTQPFELRLNNTEFKSKSAVGMKTNVGLTIESSAAGVTYILGIADLNESNYSGRTNGSKNYLNYKDARGQLFSSNKQGELSDFVVEITKYDSLSSVVSGNFKGTIKSQNGGLNLQVTGGSFIEVSVVRPLFGEMTAQIDGVPFVAESCTFTRDNSGGFIFETIEGIGNSDSTSIAITVEQETQEKEYLFNAGGITAVYTSNTFSSNVFKNRYDADAGRLIVNRIDTVNNVVQGSFNFTLRNAFGEPVQISTGYFDALIR